MLFIRFSLVLVLVSFSVNAQNKVFSSKECVDANFKFEITHPGKFFGLVKNSLSVKKSECEIEISYKKILKKSWKIDICREPVHIKIKDKGSVNVVKRGKGCEGGNFKEDYCQELESILEVIQDDGLIFAKGKRENITDQHGQAYCTFLLAKKYLSKGKVFSSFSDKVDIFKGETVAKPSENCDLPAQKQSVQQSLITREKKPIEAVESEKELNKEDSF